MKTETLSKLLIVLGVFVLLYAQLAMPVSFPGTQIVNIHLISERQNMLMLGGLFFLAGIVLFATFKVKQSKQDEAVEAEEAAVRRQEVARKLASGRQLSTRLFGIAVGLSGSHVAAWRDHLFARIVTATFVSLSLIMVLEGTMDGFEEFIVLPIVFLLSFHPRAASSVIVRVNLLNIVIVGAMCTYANRYGQIVNTGIVSGFILVVLVSGGLALYARKRFKIRAEEPQN